MKMDKDFWMTILVTIMKLIPVIVSIGIVALFIWAFVTYGGKPVSEVPSWVHWIMFSR